MGKLVEEEMMRIEEKNKIRLVQKMLDQEESKKLLAFAASKENREHQNSKKKSEIEKARNQVYKRMQRCRRPT